MPPGPPRITDNDRLGMTLFLATVFHGIVILGITFGMSPEDTDTAPALDIILVQTQTPSENDDAQYLAQVSQKGGGEQESKHRPSELFTAPSLSEQLGVSMANPQQRRSVRQPEEVAMLQQQQSEFSIQTETEAQNPDEQTRLDPHDSNLNSTSARLAQELSERIEHKSDQSRTKYLNSSTREFVPARYMREWINRVERIGNLNYPDQARRQNLSGTLILDVVINADGQLLKTDLRRSSGHQVLDDAAKRIVRLAAPYAPFPEKLRKEADIIHITRSWEFTSNSIRTN